MRRRMHHAVVFFAVVLSVGLLVRNSSATPYLPPDIAVGNTLSGMFSYNLAESPPDTVPDPFSGAYSFSGAGNGMSITVGAYTFSSTPNALVRVTDGTQIGNSDFIQISSTGNETTFFPFLSGFSRQDPTLSPDGGLLVNFHFPNTYLATDTLPTSIDPLATAGPLPGSGFPNIFGQVDGISRQSGDSGIREWAFFFDVNPSNMTITQGLLQGNFTGAITGVDDRALGVPPVPVPEPSSLILLLSGILCLAGLRWLGHRDTADAGGPTSLGQIS